MQNLTWTRPLKLLAALCALVVLGACTTPKETLEAEDVASLKRIGIISLVQDKLTATQSTGILILSNEFYVYPVPELALQAKVEQSITDTLRRSGKFEIVPLAYDPVAVWETYDNEKSAVLFSDYGSEALFPSLRPIFQGKDLDAILVAAPGFSGPHCPASNRCRGYGMHGFGIIQTRNGPFAPREFTAYVSVHLDLMNASTGKTLARADINHYLPIFPLELKPNLNDYDDRDRREIENSALGLLQVNIPQGLYDMRLLAY